MFGDQKVSGVRLLNRVTGAQSTLDVTGVLAAIRPRPRPNPPKARLTFDDEEGYVRSRPHHQDQHRRGVRRRGPVDHLPAAITAAGRVLGGAGCRSDTSPHCPEPPPSALAHR